MLEPKIICSCSFLVHLKLYDNLIVLSDSNSKVVYSNFNKLFVVLYGELMHVLERKNYCPIANACLDSKRKTLVLCHAEEEFGGGLWKFIWDWRLLCWSEVRDWKSVWLLLGVSWHDVCTIYVIKTIKMYADVQLVVCFFLVDHLFIDLFVLCPLSFLCRPWGWASVFLSLYNFFGNWSVWLLLKSSVFYFDPIVWYPKPLRKCLCLM